MIFNESITGHLRDSQTPNCPVFTPSKFFAGISLKIKSTQSIKLLDSNNYLKIDKVIRFYFYKFLAGDKNTKTGFADISVEELFLWDEVKIGKSVFVKNVCNSIKRFKSSLGMLDDQKKISIKLLIQINQNLRPKEKKYGIRDCGIKVGNPKLNPDAFYALPPEFINEYLKDLLNFTINNRCDFNKALYLFLQFIFIHPFYDGNGRVSRILFLSQLKDDRVLASLVLLYLKTVNSFAYHNAMNLFRYGQTDAINTLHSRAIEWTNQSAKILSGFIEEYTNKVGQQNIDSDSNYSKVVIKRDVNQKVDESIFQFHSKKAGKNIYVNTALLNVLNQFDYYLRYELRKHQNN